MWGSLFKKQEKSTVKHVNIQSFFLFSVVSFLTCGVLFFYLLFNVILHLVYKCKNLIYNLIYI